MHGTTYALNEWIKEGISAIPRRFFRAVDIITNLAKGREIERAWVLDHRTQSLIFDVVFRKLIP